MKKPPAFEDCNSLLHFVATQMIYVVNDYNDAGDIDYDECKWSAFGGVEPLNEALAAILTYRSVHTTTSTSECNPR